ncbi:MAG: Cys-tRNA(Pro)/Cys-tRNA(Cys) deacylase [Sulfurimonas sp.]|jgi:Cys-tRNA(Pro)/Cys-tRNA(Cys) deacylase|uniref:Cys-tRNA(Pro) deacylase n=1 Tax=Sulfurimonas sp. TaxID=2022749 RepID=UPI0039E4AE1A
MTPAINSLIKAKIPYKLHEYTHDNSNTSYGLEAASKMNVDEKRVFKTIVVSLSNSKLAVGIIPVTSMLSMKLIAKSLNVKKASMADALDVERSTGYILGGVSPLGQKRKLQTIVDSSAQEFSTIYVSAGQRGLELEISPHDLCKLTDGVFDTITL